MKAPFTSKLGIAPHLVRRPDEAGRKVCSRRKVAAEPAGYPPGFFLELVRQHNWPPRFEPAMMNDSDLHARRAAYAKLAQRNREAGRGFESVSLGLPGAATYTTKPLSFGSLLKLGLA